MIRRVVILSALAFVCSAVAFCQDEPSLGDVARQTRSQKSSAQHTTVITNDSFAPGGDLFGADGAAGLDGGGDTAPNSSPDASLARWETLIRFVQSLDRAALAKLALHGARPDFPGRANWEDRLVAARQLYVAQGQELVHNARQLQGAAQALDRAHADANDPRVRELMIKLKSLLAEAVRADTAFRAVILEGRDLANQSPVP